MPDAEPPMGLCEGSGSASDRSIERVGYADLHVLEEAERSEGPKDTCSSASYALFLRLTTSRSSTAGALAEAWKIRETAWYPLGSYPLSYSRSGWYGPDCFPWSEPVVPGPCFIIVVLSPYPLSGEAAPKALLWGYGLIFARRICCAPSPVRQHRSVHAQGPHRLLEPQARATVLPHAVALSSPASPSCSGLRRRLDACGEPA